MGLLCYQPPFQDVPSLPQLGGLDGEALRSVGADSHLRWERGGTTEAACSLWWRESPAHPGGAIGCMGHFHAVSRGSGKELLEHAASRLRQAGCRRAVGPMDGNTWRTYRLVTWSSGEASFFLEPTNPDWYPACFEDAGFEPWARFSSSILPLDALDEPATLRQVRERLDQDAIRIVSLREEGFEKALHDIYELSLVSFADNFLYSPISENAFLSMYRRIEPLLDPDLVRLARKGETLVGFVFTFPDPRLERTLIVKTLAVAPDRRLAGLGSYLIHKVQAKAAKRGFTRAIHALQHETNTSLKITERHGGRKLREYILFHRLLLP